MNLPAGYPKTMHHPSYTPARLGVGDRDGVPARFSPVEVKTPDQEEQHRALGYLLDGESPSHVDGYHEYPKMLHHPKHEDGIPARVEAYRDDSGKVVEETIPGRPEKFPPKIVKSPKEEAEWKAKGWGELTPPNPAAHGTAKAAPYNPNHKHNEYPKMVGGKVIDPTATPDGPIEYPKWVGRGEHAVIVNNRDEEMAVLKRLGLVTKQENTESPKSSSRSEKMKAAWARRKAAKQDAEQNSGAAA